MLSPQLKVCREGCKLFHFTDITGLYDAVTNLTGYGDPNVLRENIISAEIIFTNNCGDILHTYDVTSQIPTIFDQECWEYNPLSFDLPDGDYCIDYIINYTSEIEEEIAPTCVNNNIVINGTFDSDLSDWNVVNMLHSSFNGGSAEYAGVDEGASIEQGGLFTLNETFIVSFDLYIEKPDGAVSEPPVIVEYGDNIQIDYFHEGWLHIEEEVFMDDEGDLQFNFSDNGGEGYIYYLDNVCVFRKNDINIDVSVISNKSRWCECYLNDCKFRCCIDKLIAKSSRNCDNCDTTMLQEVLLIEAMYIGYLCAAACDKEKIKENIYKRLERFCNFKECKC